MRKNILVLLTAASLSLAGCSEKRHVEKTSQEFNALPPTVQKAVRSRSPNAEITSVDKKTRDGMNYYVIEFKEPGRNPKLTVTESGTIVDMQNEKWMGSASPGSGTVSGRSTEPERPKSTLNAPTGTTPQSAKIDLSALPQAVQKTLQSQAPNATITSIIRHEDNGRAIFEFQFEDQGKNPTMRISEDGTVVQTLKK